MHYMKQRRVCLVCWGETQVCRCECFVLNPLYCTSPPSWLLQLPLCENIMFLCEDWCNVSICCHPQVLSTRPAAVAPAVVSPTLSWMVSNITPLVVDRQRNIEEIMQCLIENHIYACHWVDMWQVLLESGLRDWQTGFKLTVTFPPCDIWHSRQN